MLLMFLHRIGKMCLLQIFLLMKSVLFGIARNVYTEDVESDFSSHLILLYCFMESLFNRNIESLYCCILYLCC